MSNWEWHFALLPVQTTDGHHRWMQWVQRLRIPNDYRYLGDASSGWHVYRMPPIAVLP